MPLGLASRPFAAIWPGAPESIGLDITRMAGVGMFVTASAVWPAANLAIYYPFRLETAGRVRTLGTYNGATASGNWDVGIYNFAGQRLVSTGSTAMAGTTVLQSVDIADTDLPPGRYYLGLSVDNGTAAMRRISNAALSFMAGVGILQESTAFPLPATMTPVTIANLYLPFHWANFGRLV